jgi:hypothetical protein
MRILILFLLLYPNILQAKESYRTNYISESNYQNPYPVNDYRLDPYFTYMNEPDYD